MVFIKGSYQNLILVECHNLSANEIWTMVAILDEVFHCVDYQQQNRSALFIVAKKCYMNSNYYYHCSVISFDHSAGKKFVLVQYIPIDILCFVAWIKSVYCLVTNNKVILLKQDLLLLGCEFIKLFFFLYENNLQLWISE